MAVACLSPFNCEYSSWLLLLWAGISTELHIFVPCFDQEKKQSFEGFTMSVAWVVDCGENFSDSGCTIKWEWVAAEVEVNVCDNMKKECISM